MLMKVKKIKTCVSDPLQNETEYRMYEYVSYIKEKYNNVYTADNNCRFFCRVEQALHEKQIAGYHGSGWITGGLIALIIQYSISLFSLVSIRKDQAANFSA